MAKEQKKLKADDLLDVPDLSGALAKIISKAFQKGTEEAFSGKSFLKDLNDQMKEYTKEQNTQRFNDTVKKRSLDKQISTQEAELEILAKVAKQKNNSIIQQLEMNRHTAYQGFLLARMNGDLTKMAEFRKEFGKMGEEIKGLKTENDLIDQQTEKRRKQIKLQIEREARQKKEEEFAERIKEYDKERHELHEKINAKSAMFKDFLSSGAARTALITAAAMKMGEAFSEGYKELKEEGLSVTQAAHESMTSLTDSMKTGFTVSAESIRKARKAIVDTGGSLHDAEEAGKGAALMAERYGGSVETAGKAIGNLQKIPGLMKESAQATAEYGAKLAQAADVPADTVSQALANNMDAAAKAGPNMTKSFAQAAVNAKKIGVEFSTIDGMAEKLLDFESSINAQMEASVLLGREMNLDRAREAALAGDYASVQKEILAQVGSEAEFTKMNVLQKKKLAEAMGVSVGDLAKMVKGQGELSDGTDLEAANREKSATWMTDIANLAMKHSGTLLGMLPTLVQMVFQYKMMKALQGDVAGKAGKLGKGADVAGGAADKAGKLGAAAKKAPSPTAGAGIKTFLTNLAQGLKAFDGKAVAGAFFMSLSGILFAGGMLAIGKIFSVMSVEDMIKAAVGLPVFAGAFYLTSKILGKINIKDVIMGSLALGMLGVAMIPAAYAFSLLADVPIENMIAFALMLPILAIGVMALGAALAGPQAILFMLGITALAMLGGVLIVMGAGLLVAGLGMEKFADSATKVIANLEPIAASIMGLAGMVAPLLAISDALLAISFGLGAMGIAGITAMPVIGMLMGLAAVAPALTGLAKAVMGGGGEGEKSDKMDELIAEVRSLKTEMANITINLDGKKVGEGLRGSMNASRIR